MRFAFTASDRYLGAIQALCSAGWEPIKLFTSPTDDRLHHNRGSIEFALARGLPIQLSRLSERDLAALAEDGCEALVVASYPWRVPPWQSDLRYAINFHPSPLPIGRGPYPQVRALLDGHGEWGVSCHKIAPELDAGDLLGVERFALGPHETHETLDARIQLALPSLAGAIAGDFEARWERATPQGAGSWFPAPNDDDRTLDFDRPLEHLLRQMRAFGRLECIATVDKLRFFVHQATGWVEPHRHRPGTLVHGTHLSMVVAVADGFLVISEWSIYPPGLPTGRRR